MPADGPSGFIFQSIHSTRTPRLVRGGCLVAQARAVAAQAERSEKSLAFSTPLAIIVQLKIDSQGARRLRISCLPVSLFSAIIERQMSLPDWAEQGKRLGLDGIDISLLFIESHSPAYLGALKRKLKETGMPLVMATTYPDFTNPDAVQRKREMAYLWRDIALASELEVRYLRVLAGQAHPGTGRAEGIEWAVDNLAAAANTAREYGVMLLYEDHSKPGAWDYYDFSYPADIFLEMCERLRGTGIRLNFDTGNVAALGLDPLSILAQVVDMVETIHVADMAESGKFKPVLIGTGVVAFSKLFKYLKSKGFDNWLCIEEASFNGLEGIQKAIEFTRRTWDAA
jgi:sugar phosphate isomerase/epimerase